METITPPIPINLIESKEALFYLKLAMYKLEKDSNPKTTSSLSDEILDAIFLDTKQLNNYFNLTETANTEIEKKLERLYDYFHLNEDDSDDYQYFVSKDKNNFKKSNQYKLIKELLVLRNYALNKSGKETTLEYKCAIALMVWKYKTKNISKEERDNFSDFEDYHNFFANYYNISFLISNVPKTSLAKKGNKNQIILRVFNLLKLLFPYMKNHSSYVITGYIAFMLGYLDSEDNYNGKSYRQYLRDQARNAIENQPIDPSQII